jgi:uroporphyrinogen decarboxylase
MIEETMTPRERWLCVLGRRMPDRLPMDYWATPEVTRSLMSHFGFSDLRELYERLHIDVPFKAKPRYIGPEIPENLDVYGCRYRDVSYGVGTYRECISHPLKQFNTVEEIERNYSWPNTDLYEYSTISEQAANWWDYPIEGGGSEPFLDYKNLRGQEQAFVDLFRHPDIVNYCLDKMFEFSYENTRKIYREIPGEVTYSYVAEDLGSQTGLLMNPMMIRLFLLPRMKRMMNLAHENGAYVFFHSDGAIKEIIPDMIVTGIDILNPIQWRCRGMEREKLKQDFGVRVVFHGGVDNQHTLPFGSEEDVHKEVDENFIKLGSGGSYILAPCHNIQPITPLRNIIAMYERGLLRASSI